MSRAEEARRPSALLRPIKAEVRKSEAESVEFIVQEEDTVWPVKQEWPVKIEPNPRQLTARVAAIFIRQPESAASTSSKEAQGPADPPRARGRPKGSKSRPRIPKVYGLPSRPSVPQRPKPARK